VDSAAAAIILQEERHGVFAVTMRHTDAPVAAAAEIAAALGIELHVFDLRDVFRTEVVGPFVEAYLAGLTPNPCVVCNPKVKFGTLMSKALQLGAERFATGHYARVRQDRSGRHLLARAYHVNKDQSYALYALKQEQLSRLIFPMGTRTKDEAREIVERRGINIPGGESQEICFVPEGDYRSCLRGNEGTLRPGPIVDHLGKTIGRHRGLARYTIGQRKGLGVALGYPVYVLALNVEANTLVVGPEELLYKDQCLVGSTNFILYDHLAEELRVNVKVRYAATPSPATIIPAGGDRVAVKFLAPERAITPGQAAVFYNGDLVVGGGTILEVGGEGRKDEG